MKYLLATLYAQGDDESDDAPDYFLLALEPGRIHYLAHLAREIEKLNNADEAIRSLDVSSAGEYVKYSTIEELGLEDVEGEVNIVDLPDDVEIEEVWKMESHSVKVFWDGDLYFYAYYKYTGTQFQTPLIGIDYLTEAMK